MSQDQEKPLRLFVDPFAAWRELAFKTAEMIAASAQAGAASVVRVAVIEDRPPPPQAPKAPPALKAPPASSAPKAPMKAPKASARKKHKKNQKRAKRR
jgi:hypothetical protein